MFDAKLMEIGKAVVDANNNNTTRDMMHAHYSPDAVSVEALAMGEAGRETVGLEGIFAKHDWWEGAHETHSASAEGPFFHGEDRFSVIFNADVTNTGTGERFEMREVAEYTVKDGKVVREEFFYSAE